MLHSASATAQCIEAGGNAGRLIKSYAQPVVDKPNSEILSVILDFTELNGPTAIGHGKINPEFIYVDYKNGISVDAQGEQVELALVYVDGSSCFEIELSGASLGRGDHEWIVAYLNHESRFKVLYEDGVTYLGGAFYKLTLPYERGIGAEDSFSGNSLFPLADMLGPNLKEKGHIKGYQYYRTTRDSFDVDSIFYLIDKLKGYGDPATPIGDLGPFAKFIPGCDLVLCSDMGVEPGDFILSSPEKLGGCRS